MYGRSQKFWGRWGPASLGRERGWLPRTTPLPTCVTMPKLVVLQGQTLGAYTCKKGDPPIMDSSRPAFQGHSRSLKPISNDFLTVIYSNFGPTSYHFRDKRRFGSNVANFPHPVYLTPTLIGFLWNIAMAFWIKN